MRAVVLRGHGGLDLLELRDDVPVPQPDVGQVLETVVAAASDSESATIEPTPNG